MKKIYLTICICCLAFINAFAQCPTMTSSNSMTICSGVTVGIALTADVSSTFTWIAADNANTTGESITTQTTGTISDVLTNNSSSTQTVTYTVTPTATAGGCVGTAQIVSVSIVPSPTLSSVLNIGTVCSANTVTYTPTSATAGATFNWSRSTVSGIAESGTSGTNNLSEVLTNTTSSPINVTYVYTIAANGCSNSGENVVVTISTCSTPCSISLTSAAGSDNRTVCLNDNMSHITYQVSGTSATVSGLPNGLNGAFSAGVVTISGAPSVQGSFNYTVTTTGGCSPDSSVTGNITVGMHLATGSGALSQNVCKNTPITDIVVVVTE